MKNCTIINNPYHVLGVNAGMSMTFENRNRNKIWAHLDIGETIIFDEFDDIPNYATVRSKQTLSDAYQTLSLSRDRIFHALAWRGDENNIWGKVLNTASAAFVNGELTIAIVHYNKLVYNDKIRDAFVHDVTHGLLTLSAKELMEIVICHFRTYHDLFDGSYNFQPKIYNCALFKDMFEYLCMDKIISVTNYMSTHTPLIYSRAFDYEHILCLVKSKADLMIRHLRYFRKIYGENTIVYKYYVEIFCSFLYSNALKIVEGITEFIPIRINSYSYASSRALIVEWVKTLSDTINYVNYVEDVVDIHLSEDSKQIIENKDTIFHDKLIETKNIIYSSFFQRELGDIYCLNDKFVESDISGEDLKNRISKFHTLSNIMFNIYGFSYRYLEFVKKSSHIFLNLGKFSIQNKQNRLRFINEMQMHKLKEFQIKEINSCNNLLWQEIIMIKESLLEIIEPIQLPEEMRNSINVELAEITVLAVDKFPEWIPTKTGHTLSDSIRNISTSIKHWIKNLFN